MKRLKSDRCFVSVSCEESFVVVPRNCFWQRGDAHGTRILLIDTLPVLLNFGTFNRSILCGFHFVSRDIGLSDFSDA